MVVSGNVSKFMFHQEIQNPLAGHTKFLGGRSIFDFHLLSAIRPIRTSLLWKKPQLGK